MFDRLELRVVTDRRSSQVRFLVNGEDVVEESIGPGTDGRGPSSVLLFPPDGPSPLRATEEPRRVVLGEPECTGGCCGYLSAVIRRIADVVLWSDWELPADATRPLEYTFDAAQYEAELTRAAAS
ncbi:hypothetical protein VM98_31500 [Streptomyces rubellomurinus subsp. indigoferus]|uniref:Uncharacterized protein n=1 Tax=Streptomyces rubellomurinus (strain ATCC 31215) TaxID=359131 RepID=A0A0F2T856_STRR3|nr:hypothetical protein [Streptomyces rubellomurinus]KJS52429.1 hypothetical protein VM98_31500 [Streptomyces rubellomurinus subsp. indigoferus]KJS58586.1 hypothetical protein VM95_32435 [Streptomyces rubellomurinus]